MAANLNELKAERPDLAHAIHAMVLAGARGDAILSVFSSLPAPSAKVAAVPAVSATPAPSAAIEMLKAARPELAAVIGMMADWNRSLEEILAVVNSYPPNAKAAASAVFGWAEAIAQVNKTVAQERGIPSSPAAVYALPPSARASAGWDAAIAEVNRRVAMERGLPYPSAAPKHASATDVWADVIAEINKGVAASRGGAKYCI